MSLTSVDWPFPVGVKRERKTVCEMLCVRILWYGWVRGIVAYHVNNRVWR
jgi:hypothetical protein